MARMAEANVVAAYRRSMVLPLVREALLCVENCDAEAVDGWLGAEPLDSLEALARALGVHPEWPRHDGEA